MSQPLDVPLRTVLFARYERGEIDTLIIVQARTEASNADEFADRLRAAVDAWTRETEDGKRIRVYSSEDTNIGDVADFLDPVHPGLQPFLDRNGIFEVKILGTFDGSPVIPFDRLLINPD